MAIEIICPACRKKFAASDKKAGRIINCPHCDAQQRIPQLSDDNPFGGLDEFVAQQPASSGVVTPQSVRQSPQVAPSPNSHASPKVQTDTLFSLIACAAVVTALFTSKLVAPLLIFAAFACAITGYARIEELRIIAVVAFTLAAVLLFMIARDSPTSQFSMPSGFGF